MRINRQGQFLPEPDASEPHHVIALQEISGFDQLDELLTLAVVRFAAESFADGRALSLARQLRLRGFEGAVELIGDILPDQLPMVVAAGIDIVEISEAHAARCTEAHWREQASKTRFGYQRSLGRAESAP